MKRAHQLLMAGFFLALSVVFLRFGVLGVASPPFFTMDGTAFGGLESHVRANIPLKGTLTELGLSIRFFGGQREYNRIFIFAGELIPDIDPPTSDYYAGENTAAILQFADQGIPTYAMIIPTVSAIRQQSLPQFGEAQVFNQKQFIEEVYSSMIGRATVIDVYPTLFNAREQYLYYRTEDALTSLGGFYIYSVLAPRLLGGISPPSLSNYNIEYVTGGYLGNLYEQSPFADARADVLYIYRFTGAPREYFLEKRDGARGRAYSTMYPMHLMELSSPMDIYLGGHSAVTTITSNSPYLNRLLVFGDRSAIPWLPFIASYYRTVTLVDLFLLDPSGYEEIDVLSYDHVLFAYGIEKYMHRTDLTRALRLLPEDDVRGGFPVYRQEIYEADFYPDVNDA